MFYLYVNIKSQLVLQSYVYKFVFSKLHENAVDCVGYESVMSKACVLTCSDGDSSRPTPAQPTISISITDAVIIIEAGKDITFRCTGRSLVSSVSPCSYALLF